MKKTWSKIAGILVFRFLQSLGWCLRFLPGWLLEGLALVGAATWFYAIRYRRRIVLLNLCHAFPKLPDESSAVWKIRIHRLALRNLAGYLLAVFELLEKSTWSFAVLKRKVVIEGIAHVERAIQDGKGAFLLTAHLGNWEMGLGLSPCVGRAFSVIVRNVHNGFLDEVLARARKKFDVNLLPEFSSGMAVMRAFKKGDLVAFFLDQHLCGTHAVHARFFNLPAWTARGLALIASRLNAPVLPVFTYRKNRRIHVAVEPPLDFSDLGECRKETEVLEHVQRCNDRIEAWVRKYPEQYFWIHRRFKGTIDYDSAPLPFTDAEPDRCAEHHRLRHQSREKKEVAG